MNDKTHLPVLDGIRGIAILAVIISHVLLYSGISPHNSIDRWFFRIFYLGGGWGVDLFFVLSGFLITGILISSRGSPHYFKYFYLRRTLRIFPLYYLYLYLIFFVVSHFYAPLRLPFKDQLWFWAYLSNFKLFFSETMSIRGTGQLWSLAIEEQFYLCWPFLIASFPNKNIKRILVGIFFLSFLVRILLALWGYDERRIQIFTFAKIDMLAAGALLAIFYKEGKLILPDDGKRKGAWPALLLTASCSLALGFVFHDFYGLQALRSSCFGLFFVCFIASALLSAPNSFLHKILSFKPLTLIGKYSYSMYLFQTGIISILCWALAPFFKTHVASASAAWILLFSLSAALSASVGWFTYAFFERFFLNLKDIIAPQHVSATQLVVSPQKHSS